MLEILKKYGIPAGVATVIVLAITVVPIYIQFTDSAEMKARIAKLENKIFVMENK